MAQIILDSNNNLIQGDFDNATLNNRTKLQTTTTNATTNVYVVPNGSSTSAGVSVANNSSLTNASKIVMATNGATDTQIISGINGSGSYLPLSFYTNNALAMQVDTNNRVAFVAGTAALPAITTTGDTNTGIFFSAADTIDFAEGGTAVGQFDSSANFKFNSGYGSVATAYGCRAWVNFNGTGTVAIRASGNVSSITDGGTGTYTINFTNAMPDANYSVGQATGDGTTAGKFIFGFTATPTTTPYKILTTTFPGVDADISYISVAFFR